MATTTPPTATSAAPSTSASGIIGNESSLSSWAGPYVTDMLGKGQALSNMPYQAYTGPLTAGPSQVQTSAFQGIAGLTVSPDQMKAFTPTQFNTTEANRLMNPYLTAALEPQLAEARRQAEITNLGNRTAATRAGAFGGGRGALMESEGERNLATLLARLTGEGYKSAYDTAQTQFNVEQGLGLQAAGQGQNFGLATLQKQADLGAQQRAIEQEGVTADINQFKEERDFPYKQVQYQQSLLQGLPLGTQSYSYAQPSTLANVQGGAAGLMEMYNRLFGSGDKNAAK